jgi:hypothetical protein
VNAIHVLHDPKRGDLPGLLVKLHERTNTIATADFDGDSRRCGRCNREQSQHVWQLIDPDPASDYADQRGVVDCGAKEDK